MYQDFCIFRVVVYFIQEGYDEFGVFLCEWYILIVLGYCICVEVIEFQMEYWVEVIGNFGIGFVGVGD